MRIHLLALVACSALLAGCAGSSTPVPDFDSIDLASLPENTLPPVKEADPFYPKDAVEKCASGIVEVAFIVDTEGNAQKITVLRAEPDDTFVQAAARTLFDMKFRPMTDASGPVLSRKSMVLEFPKPDACGKRTG